MLPDFTPGRLRAAGLTVVEIDGWEDRRRPGSFNPVGVLNHHTGASAKGWSRERELQYAKWMFLTGRDDLPAPLCQIALGRSGVVYVGAAGRGNHAGVAKASGSVAGGDGNSLYIGIEWMLSGTEDIPVEMRKAGVTLNAVLTGLVTKTSSQTVSCHYQTSVTGKWDIGDPKGLPFGNARVLDVEKFRLDVTAMRKALYGPNDDNGQPPGPREGRTRVRIGHMSGLYKLTREQWEHDARVVFARGYDWITGTEAGESVGWGALRREAKRKGYRIKRFRSNWIAVKRRIILQGTLRWGWEVLAKADEVAGRGHDLSFLYATFTHRREGVGRISILASHYPTKGRPGAKPAWRINLKWTKKAGREISAKMKALGAGKALAFYGGDQNIDDRLQDTFFGGPVTTCWDRLGKHPVTHPKGGNIDVIANLDTDKRVRCVGARAFTDDALFLFGDHLLVQATYDIIHNN